ncbi:hypothetical protein CEXT_109421 [Caerostris extrusa]|uniref:Uncharacterized protein n=1 Tax=Caerostris extrusa TaxID=172846 RepID=A0AAV4WS41_CAEEX|nr:hypothetical protein CEXT_109421 [Caerostris extrusa]
MDQNNYSHTRSTDECLPVGNERKLLLAAESIRAARIHVDSSAPTEDDLDRRSEFFFWVSKKLLDRASDRERVLVLGRERTAREDAGIGDDGKHLGGRGDLLWRVIAQVESFYAKTFLHNSMTNESTN